MTIDEAIVAKIARLSRIRVSEEEKPHFAREISGILQWIQQLNEVNTEGVEPLASVSSVALPWRADKVMDGNQPTAVLANAPNADYGCFAVPKVIE